MRENWYVPLSRKVGETADRSKWPWVSRIAAAAEPAKRSSTAASIGFVKPRHPCINQDPTFARPADKNNVHHRQPSICEIARDFPGSGLRLLTISHCLSRKWHLHFLRDPRIIYDLIAVVFPSNFLCGFQIRRSDPGNRLNQPISHILLVAENAF